MLGRIWRQYTNSGIRWKPGPMVFFAGIIAGVLIAQTKATTADTGLFSEYFLNQYASLSVNIEKFVLVHRWLSDKSVSGSCVRGISSAGTGYTDWTVISDRNALGNHGWNLSDPARWKGADDLCSRTVSTDLFLYTGLWVGDSVDLLWRIEPKKNMFFWRLWDCFFCSLELHVRRP
mgnify:CR=1 FL=1